MVQKQIGDESRFFMEHYASVTPSARRSHKPYQCQSSSLRLKRVRPGVYRLFRQDGMPFGKVLSAQVQIADPWCTRTVKSLVYACSTHVDCLGGEEDCSLKPKILDTRQWTAFIRCDHWDRIEVVTCCKSPVGKRGMAAVRLGERQKDRREILVKREMARARPKPTAGAGFMVLVLTQTDC